MISFFTKSKWTKSYHNNPTLYNKGFLLKQVMECTSVIIEAEMRYIAKMRAKLDDPKTTVKILCQS